MMYMLVLDHRCLFYLPYGMSLVDAGAVVTLSVSI